MGISVQLLLVSGAGAVDKVEGMGDGRTLFAVTVERSLSLWLILPRVATREYSNMVGGRALLLATGSD